MFSVCASFGVGTAAPGKLHSFAMVLYVAQTQLFHYMIQCDLNVFILKHIKHSRINNNRSSGTYAIGYRVRVHRHQKNQRFLGKIAVILLSSFF